MPDETTAPAVKPDFVDRCHFSETGFATWKWNEQGCNYCTCIPAPRPEGVTDDEC